jgi:hypothetical protein
METSQKKLAVVIPSYGEHEKILPLMGFYNVLSKYFDVTISLNEPDPLISARWKSLLESKVDANNNISVVARQASSSDGLSFKDHLKVISAETKAKGFVYLWIIGAGDIPNKNAIELIHSFVKGPRLFSLFSFEVHHSLQSPNLDKPVGIAVVTELAKPSPRRVEALSATVYSVDLFD